MQSVSYVTVNIGTAVADPGFLRRRGAHLVLEVRRHKDNFLPYFGNVKQKCFRHQKPQKNTGTHQLALGQSHQQAEESLQDAPSRELKKLRMEVFFLLAGVEAMFMHAQNLVALDSNEPRYNSRRGSARRCAPSLDPPLSYSHVSIRKERKTLQQAFVSKQFGFE